MIMNITIISQFIIYLCSIRNHSCNYILQEKDKGPCRKKSKKQLHGVVTKKGRDRDDTEISKLEKLMGMQPSNKKKKLPASFRNDGLDCILSRHIFWFTFKVYFVILLVALLQSYFVVQSISSYINVKIIIS